MLEDPKLSTGFASSISAAKSTFQVHTGLSAIPPSGSDRAFFNSLGVFACLRFCSVPHAKSAGDVVLYGSIAMLKIANVKYLCESFTNNWRVQRKKVRIMVKRV